MEKLAFKITDSQHTKVAMKKHETNDGWHQKIGYIYPEVFKKEDCCKYTFFDILQIYFINTLLQSL